MAQNLSALIPNPSANLIAMPVGACVTDYPFNTAPTGWVMLTGTNRVATIGNVSSGADYAASDAETLFGLYWNNYDNTAAPVSGGRGASAAADFVANKTLTIPIDRRGRTAIGAGQGSGLSNRTLAGVVGAETHQLSVAELADHGHLTNYGYSPSAGGLAYGVTLNAINLGVMETTHTGTDTAHNNMQPCYITNVIQKL